MTVEIDGARRLRTTLKKAGYDLADFKKVNRTAAATVAAHAKSTSPYKTGALQSTIRPAATLRAGIVRAGFKRVPYAGPIHWGWPSRNIKAQPWLTTTAKATEPVWVPQYELHMRLVVSQIKGK